MEPLTILLLGGPIIFTVSALLALKLRNSKTKHADLARERCARRAEERAFVDTTPVDEPYNTGFNILAGGLHVTEDNYDQFGQPLSAEQRETINTIFDGHGATIKHRATNRVGAPVNYIAGVPLNVSAFDELNTVSSGLEVEYLDPDFKWPEPSFRE